MKRSPLARRTALVRAEMTRRRPLRSRARVRVTGPGSEAWKAPQAGYCECGCGRYAEHLERHHVVERQKIRREGRFDLEWDLRNSMLLHPVCHERHTNASARLMFSMIPDAAHEFARELLGDAAEGYLERRYR